MKLHSELVAWKQSYMVKLIWAFLLLFFWIENYCFPPSPPPPTTVPLSDWQWESYLHICLWHSFVPEYYFRFLLYSSTPNFSHFINFIFQLYGHILFVIRQQLWAVFSVLPGQEIHCIYVMQICSQCLQKPTMAAHSVEIYIFTHNFHKTAYM